MNVFKQALAWVGDHPLKVYGVIQAGLGVLVAFEVPLTVPQVGAIEMFFGAVLIRQAHKAEPPLPPTLRN